MRPVGMLDAPPSNKATREPSPSRTSLPNAITKASMSANLILLAADFALETGFDGVHRGRMPRQVSINASSGTRRKSRPLAVTKVARWSKAVAAISASGNFKPVSRRIRAASSAMAALTGTR